MKRTIRTMWLGLLLLAAACTMPGGRKPATPTPAPTATVLPTPTPKPLDLGHQPLYWFGPMPMFRQMGRTKGSSDFMRLFEPSAAWQQAASEVQVFKLYGEWVAHDATPAELAEAVRGIRQRGLGLAVETGALTPTADCGQGIESFTEAEFMQTLQNIKAAGGELNFIAWDEPYYFGHFYDGPNACHWTAEKIAGQMQAMLERARTIFPNIVAGDTEPLIGPADHKAYKQWIDTYQKVNGYPLPFIHMDVDWSDVSWPQKVKSVEDYGAQKGVPVGIIYIGNFQDPSDEAWVAIAGERVKRYELETGGHPAHVLFQSWTDKPDSALPESDPWTFTGFIRQYFADKAALGFPPDFPGGLAMHKSVRVSRALSGFDGALAVDGDAGTIWNSGSNAPEWIQIDLGEPHTVSGIKLYVTQSPPGPTVHQVWGGPSTGSLTLLHEFAGETADPMVLEFEPSPAWENIRYIKVLTTKSPSWVAWREIEVTGP